MSSRPSGSVVRQGPGGRLGSLLVVGSLVGGRGVPDPASLRRYPHFALVAVTRGEGRYRDRHLDIPLTAGSMIIVTPGHPHWYGVTGPGSWDECYLVFAGEIFETALRRGLISPQAPVRAAPGVAWRERVQSFRWRPAPVTSAQRDAEACEVLTLLVDVANAPIDAAEARARRESWFTASTSLLGDNLEQRLDLPAVAASVGLPYNTWRRRFAERAGDSPAHFRAARRLDGARELLTLTTLPIREIAASLGYADERHLNRAFRARYSMSPAVYRRDARRLGG